MREGRGCAGVYGVILARYEEASSQNWLVLMAGEERPGGVLRSHFLVCRLDIQPIVMTHTRKKAAKPFAHTDFTPLLFTKMSEFAELLLIEK